MADNSHIEWTEATWNPVVGCSVVSPGCTNCYAMKVAARLESMGGTVGAKYAGLTAPSKAGPVWNGTVRLDAGALDQPLRWKRPRMIFVNSMSDLFHENLHFDDIMRVFDVMRECARMGKGHIFQLLTKRPERAKQFFVTANLAQRMPSNIWFGVSVEDHARAVERIPVLLTLPFEKRWISAEPLLGGVDLSSIPHTPPHSWFGPNGPLTLDVLNGTAVDCGGQAHMSARLSWVVVGGESGPKARPIDPAWVRSLRDQCIAAGVPFFFKQWGGVNKKATGRTLDGRTWDDMPGMAA